MLESPIILILSVGLILIYFVKLLIINKYHELNIDQYNHTAFIQSLSTNFKLKVSALRETNTYPFLIHLMMKNIKNKLISKYFSLFFEVLFLILMSFYLLSIGADLKSILSVLLVLSISTTSFSQVRFFSARVLGLFLFNTILLASYTYLPLGIKILIEIACLVPIFLASKFAHQAFVFIILPVAVFFLKIDIIISYALALLLTYIITKGFIIEILKAHILHCYWSFFNHMDYYVYGHYYREFENEKFERNEFSLKRSIRNLASFFKNPVVILIPIFFIFIGGIQLDFNTTSILIVLFIFLVLALYTRLNRSIGESGRYFDYILLPLSISLYNSGIFETNFFYIVLLAIIVAAFARIILLIKKENKSLRAAGRIFDNNVSAELEIFLRKLPRGRVVSLPISISNYLATITEHEYYYPFSYLSQYFLQRSGILPFFKFDNNNLLNKKYIDYLVVDVRQIPQEYLEQIINKYKYSLIFHNAIYQVYQKIK
ncbi:MAG: hypothetical protein H6912_08920 [Kordiimonadaceae bacterium]|nr:hypothetical protein [Kordiimonadaceae bacterium]